MLSFAELGVGTPILTTIAAEGYTAPTPIQAQAIPDILSGRDLLGIAQTGTGKTAAFALPILQRLAAVRRPARKQRCRALVLSPTRELASQIADSFRVYGRDLRLSTLAVFGGVALSPQIRAMAGGVDILVATPGRLLDHLGTGAIRLDQVEVFVLDEADRMLDLGFIRDIRRIVAALPAARQSLFFSATMPREISGLAADLLSDPVEVAVTPAASTVERVEQRVILVDQRHKSAMLAELLADKAIERALVFTRTKHGADRVTRQLAVSGIDATAIHGNKSQSQRERALDAFRSGRARVLVATDIAARGIDVDGVTHVINFELPNIAESYVHRIGRTARAGATGIAISLCDTEERGHLRGIETLIGQRLPLNDRRDLASAPPSAADAADRVGKQQRQPRAQGKPAQPPRPSNARGGSSGSGGGSSGVANLRFLQPPQSRSATGERRESGRRASGKSR